ncbi:MAG TPA: hypothetical protein VE955_04245 [Candidatus Dormibacteraeota bacterium]|nr:hypothetical protein [Candidatus Dormibacteraeota bacterium]
MEHERTHVQPKTNMLPWYFDPALVRLRSTSQNGSQRDKSSTIHVMGRTVDPYLIRGIHGLFYTSKPEEARAFVRDKLHLPNTDVGDGWLIFDFPEGDMGFHPIETPDKIVSGKHEISFYCDDIKGTVATLKKRGVVFDEEISDAGFGLITYLTIPGNVRVMLYEPKYTKNKSKDKKSIPAIPKRSSHRR